MKATTLYQIKAEDLHEVIARVKTPRLVDRKGAAELISVSPETIDEFVNSGILVAQQDKRTNVSRNLVRFLESDVLNCFTKIRKI